MMIKTPPNRWIFFLLLNLSWFGTAIGFYVCLAVSMSGSYSIPLLEWLKTLVLFCPGVNLLAWVLLIGAEFPAPLNIDDCNRPYMDIFLTSVAGVFTFVVLGLIFLCLSSPQFAACEAPAAAVAIYLAFSIRAARLNRRPVTTLGCGKHHEPAEGL